MLRRSEGSEEHKYIYLIYHISGSTLTFTMGSLFSRSSQSDRKSSSAAGRVESDNKQDSNEHDAEIDPGTEPVFNPKDALGATESNNFEPIVIEERESKKSDEPKASEATMESVAKAKAALARQLAEDCPEVFVTSSSGELAIRLIPHEHTLFCERKVNMQRCVHVSIWS